ncbi:bone morphogenetic protein receptor type-2 [Cephus cinctus]|uniref:Serine/threonine-protein kinase receptor n=1 Tax=Cephus cinctus TaxID=211228 RepID=A0AAJ7R7G5_CEPCN|nr:bone morphogenetic protein receptor type-2 [Cephus cinctus]XP_015610273.1 bone morphogenetic protein receptor type-2 [Cephus cinctus]XP_015610274.1 bone morphogenetic protein receptor type-2 [Cephus cinctus]XP_015610275.1 bone morphogenetic protein receptor type-2 [Cephus cinctus]XP_015610276.1 bone morphogenetic protein receptor type-2 [Cephus cinctus]XP_024935695.1 bone morphogenetic protein receptor type-2 [Cephus cinctus]XP_024935696.1 bone morphogenetic protein receptor type-2 [Cephus
MRAIVSTLLVALLCGINSTPIDASRICASQQKNIGNISLKQNSADSSDNNSDDNNLARVQRDDDIKFENCNNFCYALWKEDKTGNGTEITILLQGCWKQSGEQKCENTECIALQHSTKALNNTKFCCCRGNYCNSNITDAPDVYRSDNKLPQTVLATEYLGQSNSERWMLIIVSALILTLLVICTIAMLIYRVYRNSILTRLRKPLSYGEQLIESTALRTGTYTVDHLKLTTIVGQGRYGSVWQGSMGDQDVAVKIFPSHYRNYFQNERDTYCLPFMKHPSLLSYYGVDERISMDGSVEYLLVLSFAPGGTLIDYLRAHTVDWISFCKMGLSVAKGLAYLHTDVRKGEKFKPCVAHRDINSRNILIKADGTCCICDLGLAVQISGSKYYCNGEEQHAETKSINDVGTLRYMAPEVLEGAVNLRDCESSLKQIDVYSMGLVLWELVSRCSDIYVPGSEVPAYKQPFENEIGLHPTFEQMQVLVSRNKARPLLDGNLVDRPGVRLIRETMEDCWDSDAEARLTALCIEERLVELQSHRVTMYFTDGSPMVNPHCALVPSTTNSLYSEAQHHDNVHVVQLALHIMQDIPSADATVDNLVTLSPTVSVPHEHSFKNSNEVATCNLNQTLQPYQGRNPCMERNLMSQSDSLEELRCNGNVLVDKSLKHTANDQYRLSSEVQGLVSHDYLSQHSTQLAQLRPATPIPYVQNVISENGIPLYSKRKQTNMPETCSQESPRKKKFGGWSNFKKLLVHKKMHPYTKCQIDREDSKSNLLSKQNVHQSKAVDTNVTISPSGKYVNGIVGKSSTSIELSGKNDKNVVQSSMQKSDNDNASGVRPSTLPLENLRNKRKTDNKFTRQESIDKFNEVFNTGANLNILKDPNIRIKTPGDLPPSVRKMRGRGQSTARFSLYDDRMMCNILNEEDDRDDRTISNSVPFDIDLAENDGKSSPGKLLAKDVTCF